MNLLDGDPTRTIRSVVGSWGLTGDPLQATTLTTVAPPSVTHCRSR